MKKRYLLLCVYAILLSVAVTFAWMSYAQEIPYGKDAALEYGNGGPRISVESSDLDVQLIITDENGVEQTIEDSTETLLDFRNALPSDILHFKLRFVNRSSSVIRVNILFSEMEIKRNGAALDEETAMSKFGGFFAMMSDYSYPELFYAVPSQVFKALNEDCKRIDDGVGSEHDKYSFSFLKNVSIPPSSIVVPADAESGTPAEYSSVELRCALYFSRTATLEEFSNIDLSIGKILILQ